MEKITFTAIGMQFPRLKKLFRIMKLTTFLVLISMISSMASKSYSQTKMLNLNLTNTSVKEVLSAIENQSEFYFMYSSKVIDVDRKVSVDIENENVEEVLTSLFEDEDVDFTVKDRLIVLTTPEIAGAGTIVISQQKAISGVVVDENGEPLPGVTVVIKGTTTGQITDFDGKFQITDVPEGATLEFSFVGMRSQEVAVGNQSVINVTMEEETIGLDEVVAVGYGVMKKSNVTGSIASVKSEALENRSTEDVGHSIQGKVAGVQVLATSGAPNAKTTFRIRGYSSTGSSDPLYIVDGLKVADISYLNQESIESVEILKDASSAAIYGAEAGNGVVLITTKKGSAGKSRIFYNMQYSVSSQGSKMDMMNASQFGEYWTEAGMVNNSVLGNADTDWQDVIFDKGHLQRHTVGFEGSDDKGSLYVALSYLHNNGMVTGNKDTNERVTAQVNASYKMNDWLTIGTTNSIERGESSGVSENSFTGTGSAIGGAYFFDPTVPVVYENDSDAPDYLLNAEADGWNVFRMDGKLYGNSRIMQSNLWNPLGMIDYVDNKSSRTNINGTMYGDITPIEGLTFTSRLGYRIGNDYSTSYTHPYYWNPMQNVQNGSLDNSSIHNFYYQWENFGNYLFTVGKSDFAVMAGMQFARNRTESQSASTNRLRSEAENYRYLDYSSPDAQDDISGNVNISSNISYFGRISWSYDNRYTLQGSIRGDAYDLSKLSAENRWGVFPAVSGSWTVSNEGFMEDVNTDVLSNLRLRASWGINGNISSLRNYPYAAPLALGGSYYSITGSSGLITGAAPSNILANPSLSWEESDQVDVGLDARFLGDRLTFGFDYYVKNTTDMLSTIDAPSISGLSRQTINAGKIRNSGLEFELSWRDNIGDLNYSIETNLSTINNEVIESPYGETGRQPGGTNFFSPVTYFEAGYPIWYIRTYVHDHIDEATGLPIYKTAEELGTDDGKDNVGSAIPDFTYGITLNLDYKGFDLKVFGSGVQGVESFLSVYRPDSPLANLPSYLYTDRWSPTNVDAAYPKANSSDGLYATSDFWVHDASYFKIKQIQLGYTFQASLLDKIKLSSLRAFVSLENFFTFTKYPGNDPESMSTVENGPAQEIFPGFSMGSTIGVDRINYPTMKSVLFGINLSF